MRNCPVCRASLNGALTCRRCRADLARVQAIEALGERLRGAAMASLASGDVPQARQLLRRARAVHRTADLTALETLVRRAPPAPFDPGADG